MKQINYIENSKKLLEWNKKNLVYNSDLHKTEIAKVFAPKFKVKANGRSYDANYDNYYDFLNKFRADIEIIDYDIHEFIEIKEGVVMPLIVHVKRLQGIIQHYTAILILKFNSVGKIVLWEEVYVELNSQ